MNYTNLKGVETAIHYPTALPLLPAYDYLNTDFNLVANSIQHHKEIISLPMYPELEKDEITYVVNCIKDFFLI